MTQYNIVFLNRLDELAPIPRCASEPEIESMYALVMDKAGLNQKKLRNGYKALLIAAIIVTMLLIAAAAFYAVSDAFRGILKEQNSAGELVPISSMSPVVDKTGALVQEVVEDKGMNVTVRGVVGDAEGFKIIVDVEDLSGEILALKQTDGTLSQKQIQFDKLKLRTEDTLDVKGNVNMGSRYDIWLNNGENSYSGDSEWIDSNPADNKTTILICVDMMDGEPLVGKTLYMTLENLLQDAVINGCEVGMNPNDMYEIVNQFDPVSDADFTKAGYRQNFETGETVHKYEITSDSDNQVSLASGLTGYIVTNAAVRDNVVYLRGTAPYPNDGEALFNHPQLFNLQTGEYMSFSHGGASTNTKTGGLDWTLSFENAPSLESLRGYVLVLNAGDGLHPLREGKWDFIIPMNYENATRILEQKQTFLIKDYSMTTKKLVISPYTLRLETTVDAESYKRLNHRENPVEYGPITTGVTTWDKLGLSGELNATLTMRDGKNITISGGGGGDKENFVIYFDLKNVVIDPEQVQSFSFGDLTVQVNSTGS